MELEKEVSSKFYQDGVATLRSNICLNIYNKYSITPRLRKKSSKKRNTKDFNVNSPTLKQAERKHLVTPKRQVKNTKSSQRNSTEQKSAKSKLRHSSSTQFKKRKMSLGSNKSPMQLSKRLNRIHSNLPIPPKITNNLKKYNGSPNKNNSLERLRNACKNIINKKRPSLTSMNNKEDKKQVKFVINLKRCNTGVLYSVDKVKETGANSNKPIKFKAKVDKVGVKECSLTEKKSFNPVIKLKNHSKAKIKVMVAEKLKFKKCSEDTKELKNNNTNEESVQSITYNIDPPIVKNENMLVAAGVNKNEAIEQPLPTSKDLNNGAITQEEHINKLKEESKYIKQELKKEETVLQNEIYKTYQEIFTQQTKELMAKVMETTCSMQAVQVQQMTSVIDKLIKCIEKLSDNPNRIQNYPQKSSITEMTYDKFEEILKNNSEGFKERQRKLEEEYERKKKEGYEVEDWYKKQKMEIQTAKKKFIADALKKTAEFLEPTNYKADFKQNNEEAKLTNENNEINEDIEQRNDKVKKIKVQLITEDKRVMGHKKAIINDTKEEEEHDSQEKFFELIFNNMIKPLTTSIIESFIMSKQNPKPPRGIRISLYTIENYIEDLFSKAIKNINFMSSIKTPLNRNPLFILGYLQNKEYSLEGEETAPILPLQVYLSVERERKLDSIEPSKSLTHEGLLVEWSNIHNKCLFDVVNDILDLYRPYGIKGPPLPWSHKTKELTYKYGASKTVKKILVGVKKKVLGYAMTNAGTVRIPENFNFRNSIHYNESQALKRLREEILGPLLNSEVSEADESWLDIELEETQVKLDITEVIVESIVKEIIDFLIKRK